MPLASVDNSGRFYTRATTVDGRAGEVEADRGSAEIVVRVEDAERR
jgi:hypothetical protein